jgi:hypothetical protein
MASTYLYCRTVDPRQNSLIAKARTAFHQDLTSKALIVVNGVSSIADKNNAASVAISAALCQKLGAEEGNRLAGQTAGDLFEKSVAKFLSDTFPFLSHLRPGKWTIGQVHQRDRLAIAQFDQYAHLVELDKLAKESRELRAILGGDYTITPDVIISRATENDESINAPQMIVDENVARRSSLRDLNGGRPILHASISTKWTLRSDRSQNARTEALNLIRNRKGRLPHAVIVTAEPLPSRIASVALGTGDIDCVYHIALPELIEAVNELGDASAFDSLETLVSGRRLKDISDLPLDLAV